MSGLPTWASDLIRELRSEAKQRRLKNKELEEAQRKKDQERLEKQGEYKQLADELTAELIELRPLKDLYQQRIEDDKEYNAARIESIPETYRSMIPTDYAPDKLRRWLDTNAQKLVQPSAPNIDAGAGVGGSRAKPIKLTAQQKQMALYANMTEDEYIAQLKKARADE
jgi:hypothetical protein